MTELDRIGITTVFPANTEFDTRAALAALFNRDSHQFAYPFLIDGGERIPFHDFELSIMRQERSAIIPAHAERGLSQVVCAKTEKLRVFRDLIGGFGTSRAFHHLAHPILP